LNTATNSNNNSIREAGKKMILKEYDMLLLQSQISQRSPKFLRKKGDMCLDTFHELLNKKKAIILNDKNNY
jgi:hypothetical protein